MDHKETIIQATIDLINENGKEINDITVREICGKAKVGLGLVNYHFGNKDQLIEICVERMVNGIVEQFRSIREKTEGLTPVGKLDYLGNMTLTFLFEHYAVSKISIITDMNTPKEDDNTHRTFLAYLPLVAACRPDWDETMVKRKTFCLIAAMQQAFLRHREILEMQGVDLTKEETRKVFHRQMLQDLLGV